LFRDLNDLGISTKFLNTIKTIYSQVECAIKLNGNMVQCKLRLKTSCVLLPVLFNIFINSLVTDIKALDIGIVLTPRSFKSLNNKLLLTVSYTFLKSTKTAKVDNFLSFLVSIIDLSVLKWSIVLLLLRKPWCKGIFTPISKCSTSDPRDPLSYRGITLALSAYKLYCSILNNRLDSAFTFTKTILFIMYNISCI
jgi:hypothetical protein